MEGSIVVGPTKQVRLIIKICLNKTYNKISTGKYTVATFSYLQLSETRRCIKVIAFER
jgi:hypothetical protein